MTDCAMWAERVGQSGPVGRPYYEQYDELEQIANYQTTQP